MHSVSDLTTSSRRTSGSIPPKLVGASTTVIGDKLYLFGGRLVAERRMVADLYVCDLESFVWTRVPAHSLDDAPRPRYFHNADGWENYLVIFGGMGHKPDGASADDLIVLNDIRFLDLSTYRWLPPDMIPSNSRSPANAVVDPIDPAAMDGSSGTDSGFTPRARYAHLSAVSGSRLYIIGGQDLQNAWLDDVCVYDLRAGSWIACHPYPRHAGTYRSVAVAAQYCVRDSAREHAARTATGTFASDNGIGPPGGRFAAGRHPPSEKEERNEFTSSDSLIHLPYSAEPTDEFPNEIFLYSNYNFTDVKRELEVLTPSPEAGNFELNDRSSTMTGPVLPPGLRFPTGAICGNHLIFAGTYLAHSFQSYSIWALDLNAMTWSRLDPGAALATGSWFRAALWNQPSKGTSSLLIFGNREGSLVEDYNRRLLAWNDVAVLDLEAFGIYQPTKLVLDITAQELGLAALEEELLADFELVCDDGRRVPVSRRLLEARWPWFREQRRQFHDNASRAVASATEGMNIEQLAEAAGPPYPADIVSAPASLLGVQADQRPDPRLTPRAFMLSEPYAVTLAFAQYIYAQALITPLQHAPAVLSQLMLMSSTYGLTHLQTLVRHAMHRALAPSTSVGVYEVATLCGCQSLQIRALKAVMASSKRNAGRARGNSSAGAGPGSGGGSAGGGAPSRGPAGNSDRETPNGNGRRSRGGSDVRGANFPYGGSGAEVSQSGVARDMKIAMVQKTAPLSDGKSGMMRAEGLESDDVKTSSISNASEIHVSVPSFPSISSLSTSSGLESGNASKDLRIDTAGLRRGDGHRQRGSMNLRLSSIITALQEAEEEYGYYGNPENVTDLLSASLRSRPISRGVKINDPIEYIHRRTRRRSYSEDSEARLVQSKDSASAASSISSHRRRVDLVINDASTASESTLVTPTETSSLSSFSMVSASLPPSPKGFHLPLAIAAQSRSSKANLMCPANEARSHVSLELVTDLLALHPAGQRSLTHSSFLKSASDEVSVSSPQLPYCATDGMDRFSMTDANAPMLLSPMTPDSPMVATPAASEPASSLLALYAPHLNGSQETSTFDELLEELDAHSKVVKSGSCGITAVNDKDKMGAELRAEKEGEAEGGCRERRTIPFEENSGSQSDESSNDGNNGCRGVVNSSRILISEAAGTSIRNSNDGAEPDADNASARSEPSKIRKSVDLAIGTKSQPAYVVATSVENSSTSTLELSSSRSSTTRILTRISSSSVWGRPKLAESAKSQLEKAGKNASKSSHVEVPRKPSSSRKSMKTKSLVSMKTLTNSLAGVRMRRNREPMSGMMDASTTAEEKRRRKARDIARARIVPDYRLMAL